MESVKRLIKWNVFRFSVPCTLWSSKYLHLVFLKEHTFLQPKESKSWEDKTKNKTFSHLFHLKYFSRSISLFFLGFRDPWWFLKPCFVWMMTSTHEWFCMKEMTLFQKSLKTPFPFSHYLILLPSHHSVTSTNIPYVNKYIFNSNSVHM